MTGSNIFWVNVSKIGLGTFFSQLISFLALPFITRQFSPTEYSIYFLLVSLASIVIPFSTLRFETLAVISEDNLEAEKIFRASLFSSSTVSAVLIPLSTIALTVGMRKPLFETLIISVALSLILFVQSANIIYIQFLIQRRNFSLVSVSSLIQSSCTPLIQLFAALTSKTYLMLVMGYIVGRLLGILKFFPLIKWRFGLQAEYQNFCLVFKEHIGNSKKLIVTSFTEMTISYLPIFFVAFYFGSIYSGYIGLAQTLTIAPVTLFSGAISSIFLSGSILKNKNVDHLNLRKILLRIVLVAIFFLVTTLSIPISIYSRLFGYDWTAVGDAIRILAFPAAAAFIFIPLSVYLLRSEEWKIYRSIAITRLSVSMLSGLVAFSLGYSWLNILFCYALSNALVQVIASFFIYKRVFTGNSRLT